jgi:hypothetical protein
MANDFLWETPGSLTAYLSTSLDSLANNACDLGASIDNSSNLKTHMDLELTLAFLDLSAQVNPSVVIYMLESVDGGTDFDTGSDGETVDDNMPPNDKILCVMGLRPYSSGEAKLAVKTQLPIPPGHFKLMIRNKTGASFASSGNTLKYRTYNLNIV